MDERKPRLIRKGVPQKVGTSRVAVILVLLLLTSILTPVQADVSVARDDFGILG